jgi:hypothetical protein
LEPVKIFFICSCLEPGKDGVGDYTRKLACALINRGYTTAIAAINDRRIQDETIWQGEQQDENTMVTVLRLSSSLPWSMRLAKAKAFAGEFNPGWISFQYVPFGFQIKGLPFNIGRKLKSISTYQPWHIMFHELSVNKDESLKFKAWAFLQINIIKSLLRTLKPALITTNTSIYQYRLKEMGYPAKLLSLFSHITPLADPGRHLTYLIPEFLANNRDAYIVGTLFGSFAFKSWNLRSLLDKFSQGNKKAVIASIGRMAMGEAYWKALENEYPHIIFLTLGIQDTAFISYWLSEYTDFGILTVPPELAGKSSTFMAFKEHGIPVVCNEKTVMLESYKVPPDKVLTEVHAGRDFVVPAKYRPIALLDEVVKQFTGDLETAGYKP